MVKWIIAGVVTLIWLLYMYRKPKNVGRHFPIDIEGAINSLGAIILYLIFWIVWLIVF